MFSVLVSLFGSRALFRIRPLATLLVLVFAITLAPSVAHAANPQVPQGYGNSFPADSHDTPSTWSAHGPYYAEWDIIDATGNIIATLDNPNGWGASETSGTVYVRTPANALLASNYEVRYSEAGTYGTGYGASYSGHFDVVAASNAPFTVTLNPQTVSGGSPCIGKITLTNPAPSGGATVTLSTNDGTVTVPARVTVNAQSTTATFPVTTQAKNGSYTVGIYATFSSGVYQKVQLNVTAAPPAPPSVTASPGDKQVSLSWTASSGSNVTGYNVYRSTTSGSGYVQVNPSSVTGTTYTDPSLTDGKTYYYVVTAISSQGESSYSNEASATPTAPVTLSPPANLTVLSTGSGKITLYLSGVPNANGYNVYRGTAAGGEDYTHPVNGAIPITTKDIGPGVANMFMYSDTSGLTDGTEYFYTVTAVNGSSQSVPSNEDSDVANPAGIPWDTGNPSAVLSAFRNAFSSTETIDGPLRVAGPDNVIYDDAYSAAQSPDATTIPNTNQATLQDGSIISLPNDADVQIGSSGTTSSVQPASAQGTPIKGDQGPFRRVRSTQNWIGEMGDLLLPYPGDIAINSPSSNNPGGPETAYINIGMHDGPDLKEIDAGLQYSPTKHNWAPDLLVSVKTKSGNQQSRIFNLGGGNFRFSEGAYVTLTFYATLLQQTGGVYPIKVCLLKADGTLYGDASDYRFVGAVSPLQKADVAHAQMKRTYSIAQGLPGVTTTGSKLTDIYWDKGYLISPSLQLFSWNRTRVGVIPAGQPSAGQPDDGSFDGGGKADISWIQDLATPYFREDNDRIVIHSP